MEELRGNSPDIDGTPSILLLDDGAFSLVVDLCNWEIHVNLLLGLDKLESLNPL